MEDRKRFHYQQPNRSRSNCKISRAILHAIAVFLVVVLSKTDAAPTHEDVLSHSLEMTEYISDANSCYYNFQRYEEGDRIITNEPCLNCTCHNRMLMCYLKVCPFTKPIGQECTVEKSPDQCCPVITCPEVPVKLLTSSTTTTMPTTSTTEIAVHDNYGCIIDDNVFYPDGAQVPSDPKKPCELCYCIRNHTTCVIQECTLHVEGCKPVYKDDVCCPVRYDCDYEKDQSTTQSSNFVGLVRSTTPAISVDCRHNDKFYSDGELIVTAKPCEHCYCMHGDIVCAVQDCGKPFHGKDCIPITSPGQCCPSSYECANETYATTTTEAVTVITTISSKPYDVSTEDIAAESSSPPPSQSNEQIQNDTEEQTTLTNVYSTYTQTTTSSTGIVADPDQKFGENSVVITNRHPQSPNQQIDRDVQTDKESNDDSSQTSPQIINTGYSSSTTFTMTSQLTSSSDEHDQPIKENIPFPTIVPPSHYGDEETTVIGNVQETVSVDQNQPPDIATTTSLDNDVTSSDIIKASSVNAAGLEVTSPISLSDIKEPQQHASEEITTSPFQLDITISPLSSSTVAEEIATNVDNNKIKDVIANDKDNNNVANNAKDKHDTSSIVSELSTEQQESVSSSFATTNINNNDKDQSSVTEQYGVDSIAELTTASYVHNDETTTTKNINKSSASTEKLSDFPDIQSLTDDKLNTEFTTTVGELSSSTKTQQDIRQTTVKNSDEYEYDYEKTTTPSSTYEHHHQQQQHPSITTELPDDDTSYGYETTSKFFMDITYTESTGIPGEGSCLVRGKTYSNFSAIPSTDPCHDKCICMSSIPVCTTVKCSPLPSSEKLKCTIRVEPDACCPTYVCESSATTTALESNNQVIEQSYNNTNSEITTPNREFSNEVTTAIAEGEHFIPTTVKYNEVDSVQNQEQSSLSQHDGSSSETEPDEKPQSTFPCANSTSSSTAIKESPSIASEEYQTTVVPNKVDNENVNNQLPTYLSDNKNAVRTTTISVISKETTISDNEQQTTIFIDNENKEQNIPQGGTQAAATESSLYGSNTTPDTSISASDSSKPGDIYSVQSLLTSEHPDGTVNFDNSQSSATVSLPSAVQDDSITPTTLIFDDSTKNKETIRVTANDVVTHYYQTTAVTDVAIQDTDNNTKVADNTDEVTTNVNVDMTSKGSVAEQTTISDPNRDNVQSEQYDNGSADKNTTQTVTSNSLVSDEELAPSVVTTISSAIISHDEQTTIFNNNKSEQTEATIYDNFSKVATDNNVEKITVIPTDSFINNSPNYMSGDGSSDTSSISADLNSSSDQSSEENIFTTTAHAELNQEDIVVNRMPIAEGDNKQNAGGHKQSEILQENKQPEDISTEQTKKPEDIDTEQTKQPYIENLETKKPFDNEPYDITSTSISNDILTSPSSVKLPTDDNNFSYTYTTTRPNEITSIVTTAETNHLSTDVPEQDESTDKYHTHYPEQQNFSSTEKHYSSIPDENSTDKYHTPSVLENDEFSTNKHRISSPSFSVPNTTHKDYSHSEESDVTSISDTLENNNRYTSPSSQIDEIKLTTLSSHILEKDDILTEVPEEHRLPSGPFEDHKSTTTIPDTPEKIYKPQIPDGNEISSDTPDKGNPLSPSPELSSIATPPEDYYHQQLETSSQKEAVIDKIHQSEDGQSQYYPVSPHIQENSISTEPDDNKVTPSSNDIVKPSTPIKYKPSSSSWSHNTSELNHQHPEDESNFPQPPSEEEYDDDVFGPGTCRYGGKIYVSAQQIPREDPCDFCFCFRSDIICLRQSCPPPIHGCRQEPIPGFCCPRYECPVPPTAGSRFTASPLVKSSTLSSSHLFPDSNYRTAAKRTGCSVNGNFYRVGEEITIASGPCLQCICGKDGSMKCEPRSCNVEHGMQQMMEEALTFK